MTYHSQFQQAFPLYALTPKVRAAVEDAIAVTQAPAALVVSSCLAAASTAVQAKYNVRRLNGLSSPCSLYFITFAESGERKTTVDRLFFSVFTEFEEQCNRSRQENVNLTKEQQND